MFDADSRYAALARKTLEITTPTGEKRELRYVERRFLPPLADETPLLEHVVVQGDRLDNLAARTLGDPTQFWRIADANATGSPEELTESVGARVVIPVPKV